ncbi:MAG: thioredoxin family protein, partial [Pseudomonadota bacterium]|nr:thioredoxin family protein [Pseudomonadota bacterium]
HCPYVLAVLDRIVRDANDLQKLGIGIVAISSNDVDAYPEDSFDNMKKLAADFKFSFPYLYDESQDIARLYQAACTPDFFGFNNKDELQYRGRLDASRKEAGPKDLRRDLFEAMKEVSETGLGPKNQIASMGCSIKWKSA